MPAEGVPLSARAELLTREELARLVRAFAALGVVKLRLTGGEPTLRTDLADIIRESCTGCGLSTILQSSQSLDPTPRFGPVSPEDLRAVPGIEWVAMTTNGLVLTRRLPAYQRAGLAALNISLDSLQPERYETMSRRPVRRPSLRSRILHSYIIFLYPFQCLRGV